MNLRKSKINESALREMKLEQERKPEDAPTEGQIPFPSTDEIPLPPTDDVASPIKEPVEDDKPTHPIIDEEKNRSKMIV